MFPFFNQQSGVYYQQQPFLNQYWPGAYQQQQFLLQPQTLPQYYQNAYLNYNIYPEIFKTAQNTPTSLQSLEVPIQTKKTFSCNCVNTDCRKEYCICFKNGEICGDKCGCSSCRNKEQCQRNYALQKKKSLVCNCKKSECAKKYCECYANGIRCGESCHCQDCKNM